MDECILQIYKDRVQQLEAAIRQHRSKSGHQLCWENDRELWSVLEDIPANLRYPHATLPPPEEFLHNCHLYYESRVCVIKHD